MDIYDCSILRRRQELLVAGCDPVECAHCMPERLKNKRRTKRELEEEGYLQEWPRNENYSLRSKNVSRRLVNQIFYIQFIFIKIDEGVELFEETMGKMSESNSDNQREKLQVYSSLSFSLSSSA